MIFIESAIPIAARSGTVMVDTDAPPRSYESHTISHGANRVAITRREWVVRKTYLRGIHRIIRQSQINTPTQTASATTYLRIVSSILPLLARAAFCAITKSVGSVIVAAKPTRKPKRSISLYCFLFMNSSTIPAPIGNIPYFSQTRKTERPSHTTITQSIIHIILSGTV